MITSSAFCPDLSPPPNGSLIMSGNTQGNTTSFSCNPGFQLDGLRVVVCQANGLWSGNVPICQETGMTNIMIVTIILLYGIAIILSRCGH